MNSPSKTKVKTIDGLSIHYAESDSREKSVILLSSWPENLFTFEQMWSRLAAHAQLVAIDLPGFGHSERRNELLTPSAMGEFIAQNNHRLVARRLPMREKHSAESKMTPALEPVLNFLQK